MTLELHQGGADDAAEAAAWVVRLSAGGADLGEFEAFAEWLAAAPGRDAVYDRALVAWTGADDLRGAAPSRTVLPFRPHVPSLRRYGAALWTGGAVIAAGIAAIAVLGPLKTPQTYVTQTGQHREVALADGSKVSMNAGSRMEVRLGARARKVDLGEGEAAFDVAHDAARPFLIRSGDRTVRVVGTEFDVKSRGDALVVSVRRGIVEVSDHGGAPARLVKGDRITFAGVSSQAQVSHEDPDEAFAWREGRLVYRDAPIAEVVQALNLQFGGKAITVDPEAARLRFSGVLMLDNRDAVVRRLTLAAPLSVRTDGSAIILGMAQKPPA